MRSQGRSIGLGGHCEQVLGALLNFLALKYYWYKYFKKLNNQILIESNILFNIN